MDTIYLTIPVKYQCIYTKLLYLMSEVGIDIIKDCNSRCNDKNALIIRAWNMFQAACNASSTGEQQKADFIMRYVNTLLALGCDNPITINTKFYWGLSALKYDEFIGVDIMYLMSNGQALFLNDLEAHFTIKQTQHIHYVIIPVNQVDLYKSHYVSDGLTSILWDDDTKTGAYRLDYPNQVINNVEYKVFYNYVIPAGGVNSDINLIIKMK